MSLSNSGQFDVQKVKNAVIEALGYMGPLMSDERLYKYTGMYWNCDIFKVCFGKRYSNINKNELGLIKCILVPIISIT